MRLFTRRSQSGGQRNDCVRTSTDLPEDSRAERPDDQRGADEVGQELRDNVWRTRGGRPATPIL